MKIGSLVECIKPSYYATNDTHPVVSKIYTIRSVSHGSFAFEEIVNSVKRQPYGLFEEVHFNPTRFRELLPPMQITLEQFENETV